VENHFAADFIKVLSGSELLMMKKKRKWRTKSKRIIITAVIEYMSNKVSE